MMDTTRVVPNILGSIQNITKDKGIRNNKKHECEKCGKMVNMLHRTKNGQMFCEECYYDRLSGGE